MSGAPCKATGQKTARRTPGDGKHAAREHRIGNVPAVLCHMVGKASTDRQLFGCFLAREPLQAVNALLRAVNQHVQLVWWAHGSATTVL